MGRMEIFWTRGSRGGEKCSRLAGAKKGLGKKRGENRLQQKIQKWAFGGATALARLGAMSFVYRSLSTVVVATN